MTKITEREIYNSIINGTADAEVLVEFATKKLAQLDKRNASAAKRAAAKRAEGDALTEEVFAVLTGEPMSREQVAVIYNENAENELTAAKIGARLIALVNDGRVAREKVKVTGEDGKVRTVMGYFVVDAE